METSYEVQPRKLSATSTSKSLNLAMKSLNFKIFKYSAYPDIKYLNIGIFKLLICLIIVSWLIIIPHEADASTIINRPLAIGLNQGLVGHRPLLASLAFGGTFDGERWGYMII